MICEASTPEFALGVTSPMLCFGDPDNKYERLAFRSEIAGMSAHRFTENQFMLTNGVNPSRNRLCCLSYRRNGGN